MSSDRQMPEKRGFSVSETASLTGLSRSSIIRLIGKGKLKSTKIFRRRIIHAEGVDELLREGAE
jgi:excisionase family DNA binding protein